MELIQVLLKWTAASIIILIGINNIYLLIFSFAAKLKKGNDANQSPSGNQNNFLVLFPAYKEDNVILDSVSNFLRQDYSSYHVCVIADQLKAETILHLKKKNILLHILNDSQKRNKANAINQALESLNMPFDVCVIMDADNHVEDNFLSELNGYFNSGSLAVQTQRVSKNKNTTLSKLDTLSENINNHIFRKGQRALGFSSSLIGSGMAFEMQIFRKMMADMNVVSGFDKELELRLLENKILIKYAEEIYTYDEKVENHTVFINQRRRWVFAQLFFLKRNFIKAIKLGLAHKNFDFANKVMQFCLLPRVIAIVLSALLVPVSFFLGANYFIISLLNFSFVFISLLIPASSHFTFKELMALSTALPRSFANMLFAMFTSGRAAGKFLHTPHNTK